MASKLYNYTKEELQELLDSSNSYADLFRKLNMSEHGANRTTLRKVINKYDLDLTQINKNRENERKHILDSHRKHGKEKSLKDILKNNSPYKSSRLLKRLIEEGYKEKKCECCGIENWMEKEITFQLHHKDGEHNNNELNNLQVLCPNCHSQTDNFAGKGLNKIPKIKKEKEKQKAQRGITEDGQRYYDGYGNYKILCPICKENFMNKEASMCRNCYDRQRKAPKISKEELFEIMKNNNYTSAGLLLGVDRETVSKWYKYYTQEENKILKVI